MAASDRSSGGRGAQGAALVLQASLLLVACAGSDPGPPADHDRRLGSAAYRIQTMMPDGIMVELWMPDAGGGGDPDDLRRRCDVAIRQVARQGAPLFLLVTPVLDRAMVSVRVIEGGPWEARVCRARLFV